MVKVRFRDNCYGVSGSGSLTEGHVDCEEMGGDLVSIDTLGEQLFLEAFLKQAQVDDNVWIGTTLLYRGQFLQFLLS